MVQNAIASLFGGNSDSDVGELLPILHSVNAREQWALQLAPEEFPAQTHRMRDAIRAGTPMDDLLPDAFALAREAARRVLGERPYDVQVLGGIVLHRGGIMEMKTGEGKTLSSTTAAYLNALGGGGVHVVTVNDYLAGRDAAWMGPVFAYLGLTVGAITSSMDPAHRREAYGADITYATNNELGFDYLRDNMALSPLGKVQRGHAYCIIDEIDSILIDEARTPLIISGAADDDTANFVEVNRIVGSLQECEKDPATGDYPEEPRGDFKLDEKARRVSFTDEGLNHLEELLQNRRLISGSLFDTENFEFIHYATQALNARYLFKRDTDYVVKDDKVEIVDQFTGRILHGRRYSDGLHQAIEAKEGIRVARRNRTIATITFQNFFRLYNKISGMTGTAATEAREFGKIYSLDVSVVPTNRPVVRVDEDDVIFLNEDDKFEAICDEIAEVHKLGQPVLVGTVSIQKSEVLSTYLTRRGVRHEVLNAKNHAREAMIIAEAGAKGSVTIATNMAGRGTDIKLGGNPEFRARNRAGTDADEATYARALARETEQWRPQYEEVRELGGLYVIGTERHESRRIDNQLRGRSGRQGDPGRSLFFLSMDDDLMRLFGGGRTKDLMQRVGMKPGEALNHPLLNRSIEKAQSRVEERNFEIRKHLLEYDDVVNEQRKFVYEQRDALLADQDILQRVHGTAEATVESIVSELTDDKREGREAVLDLLTRMKETLYFDPPDRDAYLELDLASAADRVRAAMSADLEAKREAAGADAINRALRIEYLRTIDARWQEHLENLESLREAVSLRGYAQKNPLLEYKLEGFAIFDEMLSAIRTTIARLVFLVKPETLERQRAASDRPRQIQAQHRSFQLLGNQAQRQAGSAGGRPGAPRPGGPAPGATATIVRSVPKVGRNDPCPCGSGKKYKHCHGA